MSVESVFDKASPQPSPKEMKASPQPSPKEMKASPQPSPKERGLWDSERLV